MCAQRLWPRGAAGWSVFPFGTPRGDPPMGEAACLTSLTASGALPGGSRQVPWVCWALCRAAGVPPPGGLGRRAPTLHPATWGPATGHGDPRDGPSGGLQCPGPPPPGLFVHRPQSGLCVSEAAAPSLWALPARGLLSAARRLRSAGHLCAQTQAPAWSWSSDFVICHLGVPCLTPFAPARPPAPALQSWGVVFSLLGVTSRGPCARSRTPGEAA